MKTIGFTIAVLLATNCSGAIEPVSAQETVTPHAVLHVDAEREAIVSKIAALEKKGAGVKPYTQALANIDELSKKQNAQSDLQAAVERLKSSLDHQLKLMETKNAAPSAAVSKPTSTIVGTNSNSAKGPGKSLAEVYAEVAQSILRRAWKPTEYVSQGVSVFFTVDEHGTITKVAANPNSKGNAAEQERFKEFISGHPELPPPPASIAPLKLIASQDTKDKIIVSRLSIRNPKIDYSAYMADVQRQVRRSWSPPRGFSGKRVIVIFRIDHDGRIIEKTIKQSSGLPAADAAALAALDKAAPFPPLPKGGEPDVAVSFTFDYNVFKGTTHRYAQSPTYQRLLQQRLNALQRRPPVKLAR